MQQIVPAQAGFFVIDVDEDYEIRHRYPVIAFSINEESLNPVEPISILGRHKHYVLLHPDGQVFCNLESDKRLGRHPKLFCRQVLPDEDRLQMTLSGVQKFLGVENANEETELA